MKPKGGSFEKINKIDKTLNGLSEKKKKRRLSLLKSGIKGGNNY